jgi:Protein of unknown function (DUF3040)
MLSDHDLRTLAEIERHLQDDSGLRRALGRNARPASWIRRVWFTLLLVSLVLMVGMAALGASGAALECAALAVVIGTGLQSTSKGVEHRAGRGSVPDRPR